jgi:beta-1,4-mannosyl-glycoprotein beta-1,4-N-acetylglucosaminyltransferase
MKIVDCFIFYNEIKLLQFRMNYLYDYVDHFILVESALTHSGNPKPFYFEENKHLFEPYLDKIVHIKVYDDYPKPVEPFRLSFIKKAQQKHDKFWECINRGNFQRNCIARGFDQLNLSDDDIIISCDADEFVDRNTLLNIRKTKLNQVHTLDQDLYYYNVTCKYKKRWHLAKCMNYGSYKNYNSLSNIRSTIGFPLIEKGGWHFSYFGDINFMIDKIKQSADQSMNKDKYLNIDLIKERVSQNKDLFGRVEEEFETIPMDQNNYLPEGYEFLN